MAPFYGWGSTASRLEPLRGGSLLFTTFYVKPIYINHKKCTKYKHRFLNKIKLNTIHEDIRSTLKG